LEWKKQTDLLFSRLTLDRLRNEQKLNAEYSIQSRPRPEQNSGADRNQSSDRSSPIQKTSADVPDLTSAEPNIAEDNLVRSNVYFCGDEMKSDRSESTATWTPLTLAINSDSDQSLSQKTLARKMLHILGEFPVVHSPIDEKNHESKGFEDPLWTLASLARHCWIFDNFSQNGKNVHSSSLPGNLSPNDSEILRKWTPEMLKNVEMERSQYFQQGLYGSKCDVAHDLDPIQQGLVSEERAAELFERYAVNYLA
jgi:hypothetical protein